MSSVPPHPGSMENPKSEIRKPKEGRNPKTEIRRANFSRRVAPPPPIEGKTELRKGGSGPHRSCARCLRISDFGSRISFGFRVSGFGSPRRHAAASPRRRAATPLPPKTSLARVRPSLNSWRHWTFLSAASPERQRAPAISQANLHVKRRCGQECPRADLLTVPSSARQSRFRLSLHARVALESFADVME